MTGPAQVTATRIEKRGDRVLKHARRCALEVTHGDGRVERVEIATAHVRIGSRAENEVVIADDAVSRLHAELTLDEHGFRLRDLGSSNGTFVGGMRIGDVYLTPGTRIEMGRSSLTFELVGGERPVPLSEAERCGELSGRSAAMRELFATIEQIAASPSTVLVTGESGTGKELVARALHERSPRAGGPFVVFDCASVAEPLLEAELFGHERGAFTGASQARVGAVEEAEGGTLFLDEIGELPLSLQPKLLRVLERRETRRVGSNRWEPADVRIVAATHRDLGASVNVGAFREDLYYRLAVLEARVPPLRERREDLPLLVNELAARIVGDPVRARRVVDGLSAESWDKLQRQPFPGNVRELRNLVERLVVLGEASMGTRRVEAPRGETAPAPSATVSTQLSHLVDPTRPWMSQKRELVAALEESYLTQVVARHDGNLTRAADAAGIERMYFKRLLRKNG